AYAASTIFSHCCHLTLLPFDGLHNKCFDDVALFNVIKVIKGNTALVALSDFLRIVLEAFERVDFAFIYDDSVANEAGFGIARNFTGSYHTARNRAYAAKLERIANFGMTN